LDKQEGNKASITEYQPRRRSLRWNIFIRELGDLAVVDLRVFVQAESVEMIRPRDHSRTGKEGIIEPDRAGSDQNGVVVGGKRHLVVWVLWEKSDNAQGVAVFAFDLDFLAYQCHSRGPCLNSGFHPGCLRKRAYKGWGRDSPLIQGRL
jgi:hypothetical protein